MTRSTATLIGLTAILMWSLLAVLTVATGRVPAFQLLAMTFAIGACIGPLTWIWRRDAWRALRQPLEVWLVGVMGLFLYHALYFVALRLAPPAEAGLLNYLWPLLIVLFSSLLPDEKLAPHHVVGALLGLAGTALLLSGNIHFELENVPQLLGLAAAFAAAFVWATYSVLSRRFKSVPTDAVAGFCMATALLATVNHLVVETTIWPETLTQWLAIAALGIGPVAKVTLFNVRHRARSSARHLATARADLPHNDLSSTLDDFVERHAVGSASSRCGLFDAEQRLSRALVKVLCRSTGTKAAQMT